MASKRDMSGFPQQEIYVLENRPLGAPPPKVRKVLRMLEGVEGKRGPELVTFLAAVLGNHEIPTGEGRDERPSEVEAACVHAGTYGTRSCSIVLVPPGEEKPGVWYADGPPCRTKLVDSSTHWAAEETKANKL